MNRLTMVIGSMLLIATTATNKMLHIDIDVKPVQRLQSRDDGWQGEDVVLSENGNDKFEVKLVNFFNA